MIGLNITDNEVYNGLAGFIALLIPTGTPIQRGQQNRVPMPSVDCVIITTLGSPTRIGTNENQVQNVDWTADSDITADSNVPEGVGFAVLMTADFEYSVQVDFYSPYAEAWAMATEIAWRDNFGFEAMPTGMKPLYSEGRQQLPIVGAENQWIQRWTMTLFLDYQPTLIQPIQAATVTTIIPEPIDVFYPPDVNPDGFSFGKSAFQQGNF